MRRALALIVILASSSGSVFAASPVKTGQSLEDREQAACYDDAQKLCPDDFPDVDKVKQCMSGKKKLVSPACAAFYPN